MKSKSLVTKFLAIFLASMAITLSVVYFMGRTVIYNETLVALKQTASYQASKISGIIDTYKTMISSVGKTLVIADDFDFILDTVEAQAASNNNFSNVYVGFSNDWGIFSHDNDRDFTQWRATERPWYQAAMASNRNVIVTSPYPDTTAGNEGNMVISVTQHIGTIQNMDAVMSANVKIDDLLYIIGNIQSDEDGYAFLTDNTGSIIAHPRIEYFPYESPSLANVDVYQELINKTDDFVRINNVNNSHYFITSSRIEATDWILYIAIPENAIYGELNQGMMLILIPCILVSIIAILIIRYSLKHNVVEPIAHLAITATHLSEGILDDIKNTNSRNEIGILHNDIVDVSHTLTMIVSDMQEMSKIHTAGDYDYRLDADKFPGVYRQVVEGINDMISMYVNNFMELLNTLQQVAHGDFEANVKKYPGKLSECNRIVDGLRSELKGISVEINMLADSALAGDLSARTMTSNFDGDWRKIFLSLNRVMDAVNAPIQESVEVLKKVSQGDLDTKMSGDYKGDFSIIKDALNSTIDSLSSYIHEISHVLECVSNKDLTEKINQEYVGEFIIIKNSINNIIETLNSMLCDISVTGMQVNAGSEQLSRSSTSLAQGASEQNTTIDQLTQTIKLIQEQAMQNAEYAIRADELSSSSKRNAQRGSEEMQNMLLSMESIKDASHNITKIMKVIDEIAFQTNLLALNAAVEAARAGVHGKGFAVVAGEVRTLAARSQKASQESQIFVDDTIFRINEGADIAKSTSNALDKIVENVSEVSEIIAGISTSSKSQAGLVMQSSQDMGRISDIVLNNSTIAEESSSSADELAAQSFTLNRTLSSFKLSSKK